MRDSLRILMAIPRFLFAGRLSTSAITLPSHTCGSRQTPTPASSPSRASTGENWVQQPGERHGKSGQTVRTGPKILPTFRTQVVGLFLQNIARCSAECRQYIAANGSQLLELVRRSLSTLAGRRRQNEIDRAASRCVEIFSVLLKITCDKNLLARLCGQRLHLQ